MPSAPIPTQPSPDRAMILAAGLGTRMRPLTDDKAKPMVNLQGKPLIDHVLDRLQEAGISRIVVNLHYCADGLETHLQGQAGFDIGFSDERAQLLDTGGGVRKALPQLGERPFFILNTDSLWAQNGPSPLTRLAEQWRDEDMDCLMLLARRSDALGYHGAGDFHLHRDGRISRRGADAAADYAHTGICLVHPRLFAGSPEGAFSMNVLWDAALGAGRLFACVLEAQWMHIGDPAALALAEDWLKANGQ